MQQICIRFDAACATRQHQAIRAVAVTRQPDGSAVGGSTVASHPLADARIAGLLAMSAERVGVTRTVAVAMPPCKTKVQLSHGTRVVRCTCEPVMRLRYVGAGATAIRNTRCNRPAAGIEAPCTEWPRVTHSSNLRVRRSNYFVLLQADQDPFGTSGALCTRKTYWPAPESLVRSTLSRCSWRAAFDEVIPALCDLIWSL
ncbi:hypothetical protein R75483_06751 [Paraburkholderia domus]|nr:hypothetical protein R75483_06751 [Paraburkholderia domus]